MGALTQLGLFVIATTLLVLLARRSILDPSGYGVFRFFAFETVLLLLLRAAEGWFRDPFSIRQMISWVLLISSMWLAWHSFRMLRMHGSPLNSIEETRVLVKRGAYGFVRHPLYTSLILFSWGVFLKRLDEAALGLSLGASAFLMAAALFEERLSLAKFGDSYRRYVQETKRFFPFLY